MKYCCIILPIFSVLLSAQAACGAPARLRLGPEGDIRAWLVLGALPNPGKVHESCEGFEKDYLASTGGEAAARPVEGEQVDSGSGTLKWKLALADRKRGLDFLSACWAPGQAVAYAYAAVHSDVARDARVFLGSDDGVKLWVNGKLCHTNHVTRGVKRDEDSVDVRLMAGENRLLFKVDQGNGGWGLMARIVGANGEPVSGLVEVLDVAESRDAREPAAASIVRQVCGKPGALDVEAAIAFETWQRKTGLWVRNLRKDADDPEKLERTIDGAAKAVSDAASVSADRATAALLKATADIENDYNRARARFLSEMQNPPPLFATDPQKEDYIRTAPGARYFTHADGRPFIPIGYNHNPDWAKLLECNPCIPGYDPRVTDRFFGRLKASGVNLVRLMVETPPSGCIEDPIGTFRPEHVRWIDHIVTFARKHDIRLMVTPWDTFWMNLRWETCPYNPELGGPVVERIDFITKPEIIEAQKKRLKYLIDRWGNSGVIFCWELLNECDIWWGANAEQLAAWTDEMAAFVRDYEHSKWGRNHMVTTSTANPTPGGALGDLAYRRSDLDFATTHLYIGSSKAPTEPIGPAFDINHGVTFALNAISDNRPYFDGENGPIDRWIADEKFDDEVFHNMTWSHLASGGAGSGLRWPYRNPHHLTDGMLATLRSLAGLTGKVDWKRTCGGAVVRPALELPEGWVGFASGSTDAALVWIAARLWESPTDLRVGVTWLGGPGRVSYRAYDTRAGKWIGSGTADSANGKATITLIGAPASVALVVERAAQ